MAATQGIIGFGVTIGYATTGSTTYTTLGELIDIDGPSITSDDVDMTHTASPDTFREWLCGLGDGGEINVSVNFVKGNTTTAYGLHRQLKSYKITLPDSGSTWICNGYIRDYQPASPIDDRVTEDWVIKLSGKPAFTAGS